LACGSARPPRSTTPPLVCGGLAVARRSGWEVDKAALDKGRALVAQFTGAFKERGRLSLYGCGGRAGLCLYVLAELAGDKIGPGADAALLSKLVSERSKAAALWARICRPRLGAHGPQG